jgi:hypothetical protein
VVTVTSNNRRAERNRQRRQADRQQHRKVAELGLLRPPSNAGKAETDAYNAIAREDEPDVAWILKQHVGKEAGEGGSLGPVDYDQIVGRAFVVIWPKSDWQWL